VWENTANPQQTENTWIKHSLNCNSRCNCLDRNRPPRKKSSQLPLFTHSLTFPDNRFQHFMIYLCSHVGCTTLLS